MERLKRYNKQIVALMSALVILVGGILSTSFHSNATATGVNNGIEFFVNYAEPATSESQGYINVLVQNTSSGEYCVETCFWYCVAYTNGVESPCSMYVTVSPGGLVFNPGGVTGVSGAFYSIGSVGADGVFGFQTSSSSSSFNLDLQRWGWQVIAFKYKGNVASITSNIGVSQTMKYTVYYANDGSSVLLMDIISLLQSMKNIDSSILTTVSSILNSVDGVENQLSSVISYLQSVDSKLGDIWDELRNIFNKADEILNEQKKSNSWLEKIWNSIQEFFNPSDEEKTDSEQFESDTTEKSDEIGGLVEESKTEKPDVEDMSSSIDSNLDMTSANEYGAVLLNITENEYILQMLLIVVTVAIIAYVLFGKR